MDEYAYKISVIMAVYNVEPFLREAIDSVIGQDIGFENIQLILVDDGSPDGSGAICDEYAGKYPENVTVIHKENGGVSSARNAGLALAKGELVNFLDADDKLSANTVRLVFDFYLQHKEDADVFCIPMIFFDGSKGAHILNGKFSKGSRIIDLDKEWETALLSASSSFIRHDALSPYLFDTRLAYAEDAQLLQKILVKKSALGVVSNAKYLYRRRAQGWASAVQSSQSNKSWYIPYMKFFQEETISWCKAYMNYVPKFVQYTLMYHLQWRIMQPSIPASVLSAIERQEHMDSLKQVLQSIDDDVIMCQKNIFREHKLFIFQLKYGNSLKIVKRNHDIGVRIQNRVCFKGSESPLKMTFLHLDSESCEIEGTLSFFDRLLPQITIYAVVDGQYHEAISSTSKNPVLSLDSEVQQQIDFRIRIPLSETFCAGAITFHCRSHNVDICLTNLRFGEFFPISHRYRNNYYVKNGWIVKISNNRLFLERENSGAERRCFYNLCREMWKRNKVGDRNAVLMRLGLRVLRPLKKKKLWLISDRIEKAGDNGEAFFRYMRQNHPEITCCFIIKKESPDYRRMRQFGLVVDRDSHLHKLLLLLSDCVISSGGETEIYNPFIRYIEPYRNIVTDVRFIFLQHGVTKDDISGWMCRSKKNLTGFVTTALPEYNSILNENYDYSTDVVWLTGFPRFDLLHSDCQKWITIMPTWRKQLFGGIDAKTGIRPLAPNTDNSKYVAFYNDLLNHPRLLEAAHKLGYHVHFMPHPAFQHHLDLFVCSPDVTLLGVDASYGEVFAKSDLLVTDYSSTVFDFAYLRKAVLYTQFDQDEFFSGAHSYSKGYFDYERDGFGEVEYTLEDTVDRIIEYMENGCQLKEKYRQRIDNFFAFNDKNNCQRVYEKIIGIDI